MNRAARNNLKKLVRVAAIAATIGGTQPSVAQSAIGEQDATDALLHVDRTRDIETPEEKAFVQKIEKDIRAAGLSLPAYFYPFPQNQLTKEGPHYGYNPKDKSDANDALEGADSQGDHYKGFVEMATGVRWSCPKPVTGDAQLSEELRESSLAHEFGHMIDHKLHLSDDIIKNIEEDKWSGDPERVKKVKKILETSVGERIADGASTLYDMGNKVNYQRVLSVRQDLRMGAMFRDEEHNTITSLWAAQKAYNEHPRPGISIVDATKWAADIVRSQQGDFLREYKIINWTRSELVSPDSFWGPTSWGADLMGIPRSARPAVNRVFGQAHDAADRLCGAGGASDVKPRETRENKPISNRSPLANFHL